MRIIDNDALQLKEGEEYFRCRVAQPIKAVADTEAAALVSTKASKMMGIETHRPLKQGHWSMDASGVMWTLPDDLFYPNRVIINYSIH